MNYDELPVFDEDTTHGMGEGDVELAMMMGGREQRVAGTGMTSSSADAALNGGNGGNVNGAGGGENGGNQGGMLSVSVREMQALVRPI